VVPLISSATGSNRTPWYLQMSAHRDEGRIEAAISALGGPD
jgi:hypothetical protein